MSSVDIAPVVQPPSRARRILRELALQFGLLLIALALCEVALRALDLRYLRETDGNGYGMAYRYDAELGWFPIANSASTFTGSRTVAIAHNSLGLRDIEPDGTAQNLLFVGDSFVWGYDVEAGDRFTDRLRRDLPRHKVVNAGITGYGTDQEYLLLRRLWDRINPQLVMLVFCSNNDREENRRNAVYDGIFKPYFTKSADGALQVQGLPVPKSRHVYFRENWLVKHSWVARVAVAGFVHAANRQIEFDDPAEQLIGLMHDFVVARGARFMVGLQSSDARLEAFLGARGIAYTTFDGAEVYPTDGSHWTPTGHALV